MLIYTATSESAISSCQMLLKHHPASPRTLPGIEPGTDGDKKEAEEPQDLLSAHQ
jgi:hypothetical protein